ncbi:MAG: hypothetical protein R3B09_08705 [Nannocystaceae bacterium]
MHHGTLSSALFGLAAVLTAGSALAAANLRVTIPASAPTHVYDDLDYDVIVANTGNKSAAAVTLSIALPQTHTSPQVHVMGDLSGVDPRCALNGTTLSCALGTIAKGQSAAVSFSIALPEADAPLSITATAATSSSESTLADNSASDTPTLLHYAVSIGDDALAENRHCTGQGLTSFFECELFPSSITEHDAVFHGDGTITFPDAPEYGGEWSQAAADQLSFVYTYAGQVIAEFEGAGTNPSCFEGITHFPGSAYLSPYEVCF